MNSLFDEIYIRQFPSAMGVAATGSTGMAYEIAKATGDELSSVGVNWVMGPVLDVLTNARNQPLGVRTTGDDPQEVSKYGVSFMKGYKKAGIATCGKHFPSYGNLEFLGSSLDVPVITDSLEQLSLTALVPFRDAISQGIDAMMVGGCAMSSAGVNVMHACLSEQVVDDLLRKDLGFDGVVVSECLEMEALSQNIGVGGGAVMAVNAGCDLILICRSFAVQREAIHALKLGVEDGTISKSRMLQSLKRVLDLKSKCTAWEKALSPGGIPSLSSLQPSHTKLSTKAYNTSITVVRDKDRLLPLSNLLEAEEELLLLSPLVKPLPASAALRGLNSGNIGETQTSRFWEHSASIMSGEGVFKELGRSLARQRSGRVLHASYTANGVRPIHENLINRAGAIIVLTADANQNLYQHGFTKHVALICRSQFSPGGERREKPIVVVSVSSPYDFAMDSSIGTYICTYDFTETALQAFVKILFGELPPKGALPGTVSQSQKLHQSKQHWLVETWNEERDAIALDRLLQSLQRDGPVNHRSILSSCSSSSFLLGIPEVDEYHFVVRNSSTQALYGFCSTYFFRSTKTGVIGSILVDPERRKLSIGHSLHNRAIRNLLQREGIKRFQLGSRLPSIFLGIPIRNIERKGLRPWFSNLGWNSALSRRVCSMVLQNLSTWTAAASIAESLRTAEVEFDLVHGGEYAESILDHIQTTSRQGMLEIYKLAMADQTGSGIIRAKRLKDGTILGTVILYNTESNWSEAVPLLRDMNEVMGGISCPVISPSVGEYSTLLQGLILLGVRQLKKELAEAVILDCVKTPSLSFPSLPVAANGILINKQVDEDGNFDSLSAMGFRILHSFEEVTCDAATWTMVPPSHVFGRSST